MMDDEPDLFGTDPHMLHRADSPSTSVAAAYGVDTSKLEKLMFDAICASGTHGCTADDLLKQYPFLPYSSITARPSALERKHLIVRGPDERVGKSGKGQKVMRKSIYADYLLGGKFNP